MKRLTGDEYRELAKGCRTRSAESFERCDTDGFMSQHAGDTMARLYDRLAELADNGWMAEFRCLTTPDGVRVNAKLVKVYNRFKYRHEDRWVINHDDGTVEWVTDGARAIAKHGYVEAHELAPAYATTDCGAGGIVTVFIKTFRTDGR